MAGESLKLESPGPLESLGMSSRGSHILDTRPANRTAAAIAQSLFRDNQGLLARRGGCLPNWRVPPDPALPELPTGSAGFPTSEKTALGFIFPFKTNSFVKLLQICPEAYLQPISQTCFFVSWR